MNARFSFVSVLMFVAACASGPQPAPGTNPGDMSAEEHGEEASEHEDEAAAHEGEADRSNKLPEEQYHEGEAAEHQDVADQHKKAAEEAE